MQCVSESLLDWFDQSGRRDLPWQTNPTPYRVWVSEIMLQQTRVAAVIPYFRRFVARFGSITALAAAERDEVLHLWSGLGYYARARNLHGAAAIVVEQHGGVLPRELNALTDLPGIGRSTAGAILALAHGDRHPILDGNVKRVLARYHEVGGWPGESRVQRELWSRAETHTPHTRVAEYTQAMMDLGATVCVRSNPRCDSCPLSANCRARAAGTQTEFPGQKKRKQLPQKSTRFLIVRAKNGGTLLYRRPPAGVWGGLWSFPEIGATEEVESWCRAHGLDRIGVVVEKPRLTHTFTHFRLAITPLEIVVHDTARTLMDSDRWLWYNINEPKRVGLAKPVEKLLRTGLSTQILQEGTT